MVRVLNLTEKNEEIAQAEKKALKRVEDKVELEMSRCRTCANVPLLQSKEGKSEGEETEVEAWFSLQSQVHAIQGYCAGESAERLKLSE